MQQKNQAPMSEEEQEGEVIDRRNTEEISLFPHPSIPLLRPIRLCDVISCRVTSPCAGSSNRGGRGLTKCPTPLSSYLSSLPPQKRTRTGSEPTPCPAPFLYHHHHHHRRRTGSDVTPGPSALSESLTVNRDDKTHQISASTVIGWFLQYRRSFLVLSLGKEKG